MLVGQDTPMPLLEAGQRGARLVLHRVQHVRAVAEALAVGRCRSPRVVHVGPHHADERANGALGDSIELLRVRRRVGVDDTVLFVEDAQLKFEKGRRRICSQAANAVVAKPVPQLKDKLFPLGQNVSRGVDHQELDFAALDVDLHARVGVATPGLDGERADVVPGPGVARADAILQPITAGQRSSF